jgi:hypothetical protein
MPKTSGIKKTLTRKRKTMLDFKKEKENYGKEKQGIFLIGGH